MSAVLHRISCFITQPPLLGMKEFQQQLEMMDQVFMDLIDTCSTKCRTDDNQNELNKAEKVCLDRCSEKFFIVLETVGKTLNKQQQ